jgi:hydrogenase expression/formation protein HypC
MCLAVPLQIKRIDGDMADVELGGVLRQVSLVLTPEAREGDYVLVHTGFAISVLDKDEARETLALFAELEEAGRAIDAGSTDERVESPPESPGDQAERIDR